MNKWVEKNQYININKLIMIHILTKKNIMYIIPMFYSLLVNYHNIILKFRLLLDEW